MYAAKTFRERGLYVHDSMFCCVIACVAVLRFDCVRARRSFGRHRGVVQDASGAVIATPRLVLPREATGEVVRQTKTDSSGPLQRFHRTGALDPNYVVVASIEKKYLPAKR